MMPRVIRLVFVVSLQPEVKRRHFYSWTRFNCTALYFLDPFTYGDFRVDWLHRYDNIVFFERIEVLVEKSINEDDISRMDGGLHGGPIGIAEGDEVSFCQEVGGDHRDNSQVVQHIFEHC